MKLSDSNKDMISSLIILGGVVAFLIWYFKRDKKESSFLKPPDGKSRKCPGNSNWDGSKCTIVKSN